MGDSEKLMKSIEMISKRVDDLLETNKNMKESLGSYISKSSRLSDSVTSEKSKNEVLEHKLAGIIDWLDLNPFRDSDQWKLYKKLNLKGIGGPS